MMKDKSCRSEPARRDCRSYGGCIFDYICAIFLPIV